MGQVLHKSEVDVIHAFSRKPAKGLVGATSTQFSTILARVNNNKTRSERLTGSVKNPIEGQYCSSNLSR